MSIVLSLVFVLGYHYLPKNDEDDLLQIVKWDNFVLKIYKFKLSLYL